MRKGGKYLCMGCNRYFPRDQVELVEGVAFCGSCGEAKEDFIRNRTLFKVEKAAPQKLGYGSAEDESKWEANFDTSQMISVSTGQARRLTNRIDVSERAGFFSLLLAAAIDLIPVGAMIYWRHGQNPDPASWAPDAVGAFLGVVVYRILFTLVMGKSIGMALAGIRPVNSEGQPVGLFGAIVHGAFFVAGRVVPESAWKRAAARAVYFAERHAQQEVKLAVVKPGPLGLSKKEVVAPPAPSSGDPWKDPNWTPPKEQKASDPWNDPNWKPPADSGNDPWNDTTR